MGCNNAFVRDNLEKIVDFKNITHLIGYSSPVDRYFYKKELLKNLFSLKNLPNYTYHTLHHIIKRGGDFVLHMKKN